VAVVVVVPAVAVVAVVVVVAVPVRPGHMLVGVASTLVHENADALDIVSSRMLREAKSLVRLTQQRPVVR